MTRFLVDTQAFIAIRANQSSVTPRARREFASMGNELFVSVVSVWEMSIKASLGKLQIVGSLEPFVRSGLDELGVALLPLRLEHALKVEKLPFHHRDPFDRLLAAQAIVEHLAILGADPAFGAYGVRRVW